MLHGKNCEKIISGDPLRGPREIRTCGQTAVGYAVFEAESEGLPRSVLPIGWRCEAHRKIEITMPELHKAREDFRKRLGKEPGKVVWGLSNLNPDEVEVLLHAAGRGAPVAERAIEVERVGGKDLFDVPGFDPKKHRVQ